MKHRKDTGMMNRTPYLSYLGHFTMALSFVKGGSILTKHRRLKLQTMLQLYCTAFQRLRISSSSSCAPAAASLADTKATVIHTFLRCLGVIHICINCLLLILGRMQVPRQPLSWSMDRLHTISRHLYACAGQQTQGPAAGLWQRL